MLADTPAHLQPTESWHDQVKKEERQCLYAVGGIGKTTLLAHVAREVAPSFEALCWRSLRNAPPGDEVPLRSEEVAAGVGSGVGPCPTLEVLEVLRRRSLLERAGQGPGLALQPVVLEYMSERLAGAQEITDFVDE